ncbi:kinase-like protein [Dentipellis sp. KUC8613]|nr:kinase-like protein [Dentipellis sp. KUC8613]
MEATFPPSPLDQRFPPSPVAEDEDEEPESASRPSIVITTAVTGSTPSPRSRGGVSPAAVSPASSSPSPLTPRERYPGWLSEVVRPLSDFIDDTVDPRDLFDDLQEIAEGESGSVYAARVIAHRKQPGVQPPTPTSPYEGTSKVEMVAIKNVPILPSGSPKLFELRRELDLLRGFRHPNLLLMQTLYVDLVEDSLWIRMELMERSLADVLSVGGEEDEDEVLVSEKMVARFVWDVLLGLSYLNRQRIAHRDLRSDNLLLNKDGVLKIADFSSAMHVPVGAPKSSENIGVIYWQAPEMRTGLYDPLKVDVWSLGATSWELVQGEPPFSDVQDTRQIGTQLPPLSQPEIYSRSFHDFLRSCCSPVASRPDPDELLHAPFIRTASPRSAIVQLLAQCRGIEERLLQRRLSVDSQGTIS